MSIPLMVIFVLILTTYTAVLCIIIYRLYSRFVRRPQTQATTRGVLWDHRLSGSDHPNSGRLISSDQSSLAERIAHPRGRT
jgi:hypothetical protein